MLYFYTSPGLTVLAKSTIKKKKKILTKNEQNKKNNNYIT